jgi:hypothetical protein
MNSIEQIEMARPVNFGFHLYVFSLPLSGLLWESRDVFPWQSRGIHLDCAMFGASEAVSYLAKVEVDGMGCEFWDREGR